MNRMLGDIAAHQSGPGGRDCHCCGPAPLYRPMYRRILKRRERQQWKIEVARG